MGRKSLMKILVVLSFVAIILTVSFQLPKSKMKSQNSSGLDAGENSLAENDEIKKYKSWTKVNDKPQIMWSEVAALCRPLSQKESDENIHNNKYINVYVNSVGKTEMLEKKNPVFPVGTIIVKEKLLTLESKKPVLLTVMIKREKGFNPQVGDWEFMTLDGTAANITSRGKIESCQSCHVNYKENDFIVILIKQW